MKQFLKQKTTWAGIAAIATGIGLYIAGEKTEALQTIIGGIGLVFLRQAVAKGK